MRARVIRGTVYVTLCLVCVPQALWHGSVLAEKAYLAKSGLTMERVQNEPDLREVYDTDPGLGTAIAVWLIPEAIAGVVAGCFCGSLAFRVAARLSTRQGRQSPPGSPSAEEQPPSPTRPAV